MSNIEQAERITDAVKAVRLRLLGTREFYSLRHQRTDVVLHAGRDRLFKILKHARFLVPLNGPDIKQPAFITVSTGTPIF